MKDGRPVRDALDAGNAGVRGMRDLTDRRFLGLLEAAPDAMVCVEDDGRIAMVNAQAERLFGYHREELVGQQVEVLVPDLMRGVHRGHRAGYVADPRPRPMGTGLELAGRRRDGSTFPAEISLSAIDTGEGIVVTAAVRDVSERQAIQAERERLRTHAERGRMERQLQQSQRLESLGQLAGGVAHDFNNLLGVISSYAAFVAEEAERQGPGEAWAAVRADIEQVLRAADRAAGLTHQLLSFARREVVQPRVLNLNETVASVEQLLRRTLGEHVELMTVLPGGLCLATVYGIMTQAGGSTRIYSEPGIGTTVSLLLPVTDQAPSARRQPLPRPVPGRGEVVLVVEDEAALREVTRRILARNGYQVLVASNGYQAINLATAGTQRLDVLLTDVVMPGMQGREVAERIHGLRPEVRVLYMSGYTHGLLGVQGVLEPEVHLIEKPFSETSLLVKLHVVLGQDRPATGASGGLGTL